MRVLFYGQSITEQEWSKQVTEDLRKRFPNADLEIENRAIGGFASQLLIRPAEHDVYPFYPDLVIFHVFGANQQYEQIIKSIRSRTTAESEVTVRLDLDSAQLGHFARSRRRRQGNADRRRRQAVESGPVADHRQEFHADRQRQIRHLWCDGDCGGDGHAHRGG